MTVQKCCLTLRLWWDNIANDMQIMGTDLSPVGENLLSEHGAIATGFSLISPNTETFGKKPICSDVRNR